jgi:exopolysaccharide biosynthesis WecB/TagA/CpsF family protein
MYDDAVETIVAAAAAGIPAMVEHMPVHGLIQFSSTATLRDTINSFDIVGADGQPVRWALGWLKGVRLSDRLYGPELMKRLCRRAATDGIGIYLYGSRPDVLTALRERLLVHAPGLRIVGSESPPFRELTPSEDRAVVARINYSGAGLVFLGLGSPKQELFAHQHRHSILSVQLCVGAAFDFLAGNKKGAPPWMRERGLEWLFRLASEPRRLWRRYLVTNTKFIARLSWELVLARASSSFWNRRDR